VLVATGLALVAAVLHASWNIAVKQKGDRFLALWGLYVSAGVIATTTLTVWSLVDGTPSIAWLWSSISGCIHLPYVLLLARAYEKNDFSVTYPIARGSGALSAAILGLLILNDDLSALSMAGIAIVIFGLWFLATSQPITSLSPALGVGLTIGIYSVIDAYGARNSNAVAFAFSTFISGAVAITAWALFTRARELRPFWVASWKSSVSGGLMSFVSYSLVVYAFSLAPVGFVATLRELSVVIAALAGWKYLKEDDHRRRLVCATVVVVGLIVLIAGR